MVNKVTPIVLSIRLVIKLVRNTYKVTNISSPLILATNVTLMVIDYCFSPPVRLRAAYIAFTGSAGSIIAIHNLVLVIATVYYLV